MAEMLMIRKLADKSSGERITRFDPETGEKYLLNPANGAREGWPLAGIKIENDGPPKETSVSTSFVSTGISEGWLVAENGRPVHRPGGNADNPWLKTHTFVHYDRLVMKTVDGDVAYRVVEQPDKYHSGPAGTDSVGESDAEIRHFYVLELEG